MRKIVLISFPVVLFLISASYSAKKSAGIEVDSERLKKDVAYIASVSPRDYTSLHALGKVSAYIESEMRKTSGDVSVQPFAVGEHRYKNIICSFGPREGDRIIVGAHYDGCGGTIGADDNASGVAGLLEIARLIGSLHPELKHRIDCVAYSLEEPPFYKTKNMGSYVHAQSLRQEGVRVRAMVSLEMIGYFTDRPDTQTFPFGLLKLIYPTTGNFIVIAGPYGELNGKFHRRMRSVSDLPVESFHYKIELSDHINYWEFGYPALMITDTAFYRNPNYHEPSDTPDTLDYRRMAEVVKGVYWSIIDL